MPVLLGLVRSRIMEAKNWPAQEIRKNIPVTRPNE